MTPAWSTGWVPREAPKLHRETVSQTNKQKTGWSMESNQDPAVNSHCCGQLIFKKRSQNNTTEKWKHKNWKSTCRWVQIEPWLLPCTKFKYKWIKDLKINPDTKKLIEAKVWNCPEYIDIGHSFQNRIPIAQTLRSALNKCDLMKLKCFCKVRDTIKGKNRQPIQWEHILTTSHLIEGWFSKCIKKLKKLAISKPNNTNKNKVQI